MYRNLSKKRVNYTPFEKNPLKVDFQATLEFGTCLWSKIGL